jgi:serine protease Do
VLFQPTHSRTVLDGKVNIIELKGRCLDVKNQGLVPLVTLRRLLALLVATLIAGVSLITTPTPSSAAQSQADLEKSIVLVFISWKGYVQYTVADGSLQWSKNPVEAGGTCTGWFASATGHIATAGHCVDPKMGRTAILTQFLAESNAMELLSEAEANWKVEGLTQGSQPDLVVHVVQPKAVTGAVITEPIIVQVVGFRPLEGGDVALLKAAGLPASTPTPALAIATSTPEIGASLTAIGFPGSVQKVADVTRIRASFKTGTVSSQQVNSYGISGTEINADISPGMSGGPTVDDQGSVIGINSYTINGENQNFNFITNAEDLRTFLQGNNVPLVAGQSAQPTPGVSASSKDPVSEPEPLSARQVDNGVPMLPIVIGVLAVLLIGGAFLLLRRRGWSVVHAGPTPPQGGGAVNNYPPYPAPQSTVSMPRVDYCADPQHDHPPQAKYCNDCGKPINPSPAQMM